MQSAKLFFWSSDFGVRGTLAGERGVGRVPILTRGHTLRYSVHICTLWQCCESEYGAKCWGPPGSGSTSQRYGSGSGSCSGTFNPLLWYRNRNRRNRNILTSRTETGTGTVTWWKVGTVINYGSGTGTRLCICFPLSKIIFDHNLQ
jgi:hypothetical protein